MSLVFFTIAAVTIVSAIAAMSLRNLVHCALCAALTFAGLAGIFLQLGAQFVGFAQILVYVGAVAILIVFAILLTRGMETSPQAMFSPAWWSGILVAGLVWLCLTATVLWTPLQRAQVTTPNDAAEHVSVRQIGQQLMTEYVLPLEIAALLLTAATIGAVIIAMREPEARQ